jgi:dienelactone hydrolase
MVESRVGTARAHVVTWVVAVAIGPAGCAFHPDGLEVQQSDGAILPAELVEYDNDRGETLQAVLLRPDESTTEPMPTVLVLHGSGGLFSTPDRNDTKLEVSPEFADWAGMLTRRGYAVLLPDSFYSRGYFEWDDHPRGVDETDRLIMRSYDVYGALRYMCEQSFVDCERVGLVGFSNGGSVALMAMHERLDEVSGMSALTPAADRERFVAAFPFYPGCDFQGLVDDAVGPYYPTAPVAIHHGSEDPLLEHCPERVDAAQAVAQERGVADVPLALTIYDGADHGFDGDPRNAAEVSARDKARTATFADLDRMLEP